MFPLALHRYLASPPRCPGELPLDFYHHAAVLTAWAGPLSATDASLSGPSPPQGACGFSSAADTNRIRDDILPG